jgi:hypothetical protein
MVPDFLPSPAASFVLKRLSPGRRLPSVPTWPVRVAAGLLFLLRHIRSLGAIFGRGATQHGHRDRHLARATTR